MNTNNLAEDLKAKSEITITKDMNNYIFHLLFLQTYYIIFDIFYPMSTITSNCNIFTFSSIKTEINPAIKYHQKFIIGNLVYKLEQSKVETEVAFLY